jgi:hypothetical protein
MTKKKKPITSRWQDSNWVYVPAVATNVLERFKQFGFVPPSECKFKQAS